MVRLGWGGVGWGGSLVLNILHICDTPHHVLWYFDILDILNIPKKAPRPQRRRYLVNLIFVWQALFRKAPINHKKLTCSGREAHTWVEAL